MSRYNLYLLLKCFVNYKKKDTTYNLMKNVCAIDSTISKIIQKFINIFNYIT